LSVARLPSDGRRATRRLLARPGAARRHHLCVAQPAPRAACGWLRVCVRRTWRSRRRKAPCGAFRNLRV